MTTFVSKNEQATLNFAADFAQRLKRGDVVALHGNLGVGKTVFSKGVINALAPQKTDVPSPTFTLVQEYDTPDFPIYHFDFYRLKKPEEAYEIGIEEAFGSGVSLIEWPDKIGTLLPKKCIDVFLEINADGRHTITVAE